MKPSSINCYRSSIQGKAFCFLLPPFGTANIKDRSLLGSRDSEIGVLIEDKEFVDSCVGRKPWKSYEEPWCPLITQLISLCAFQSSPDVVKGIHDQWSITIRVTFDKVLAGCKKGKKKTI
ncbi:Phospholipase D zeta 1 [Camellia lanceoleosa]|uniref:Phospholipase D zeta 1 n=1 Tax=Camellia lanceoleosa TaxID=1840588 RepID=A0ACC0G565_9ERIC|nr:Phospholipase D zeta 1 [Camellia lanceoleosa]